MLAVSRGPTLVSTLLISFLLFFANMLVLLSYNLQQTSQQVEQKLGIYFYLDDSLTEKDAMYSEVIRLLEDLKESGLEVTYYSKERAFDLLSKRLPDVIDDLERYGIENPLPPTIYVLFSNQQEYETLKEIMFTYEDVINNMDELQQGVNFGQQEQRVSTVINALNLLRMVAYVLIIVLLVIISAFVSFVITISFYRFRKQIEVEKLLGASYLQIQGPFLLQVALMILGAFACLAGYLGYIYQKGSVYMLAVFQRSLESMILPAEGLISYFIIQVALVLFCGLVYSLGVLWNLMRKV